MGIFLFKKFIKNYEDVKDPKVRDSYGKLAGIVGILSNLLLCVMKMLVGFISGSIAIVADAVNNLADASSPWQVSSWQLCPRMRNTLTVTHE